MIFFSWWCDGKCEIKEELWAFILFHFQQMSCRWHVVNVWLCLFWWTLSMTYGGWVVKLENGMDPIATGIRVSEADIMFCRFCSWQWLIWDTTTCWSFELTQKGAQWSETDLHRCVGICPIWSDHMLCKMISEALALNELWLCTTCFRRVTCCGKYRNNFCWIFVDKPKHLNWTWSCGLAREGHSGINAWSTRL